MKALLRWMLGTGPEALTLKRYQERSGLTRKQSTRGHPGMAPLVYVAMGLGSEVGEVQNEIKKQFRDDGGDLTEDRRERLADEAGDVLWYLAQICEEIGVPLEQVAQKNLEKLATRYKSGRGVAG